MHKVDILKTIMQKKLKQKIHSMKYCYLINHILVFKICIIFLGQID